MRFSAVLLLALVGFGSFAIAGEKPSRTRASEDRPTWHITALPEEGNCIPYDANGCIFWKGKYHLMYIFQEGRRPEGGHSWGHASSTDLVNWTFHPAALVPEQGDADIGTFSGNAFVSKEGKPMLCWMGLGAGVCVATAEDDDLIHWKKHPKNPIIPVPKKGGPGDGVYKVWDPYLWLEGDTYYCLLGGNVLPNGKDTLFTMKSKDLVHWEPLHPFYEHPDLSWTVLGEDCSCPDFFKLGDKRVLMCISHTIGARCYVGRYENEKFVPEQHVRMNWPGGTFFAPESLEDAKGRRIFWAWVLDPRQLDTKNATGAGVQSMPRVLSLDSDGTLQITPAPELQQLRRNPRPIETIPLKPNEEVAIPNVSGDSLELAVEIDPGQALEIGLKVRCSPDGKEETSIIYDAVAKTLKIDMSQSTLRSDVTYRASPIQYAFANDARKGPQPRSVVEAPFALRPGEPLRLRVFLDKSMLEVFANDRQCVTQQIFPESREAIGVKAFARGFSLGLMPGDVWKAAIISGQAWDMAPATFVNEKAGRTAAMKQLAAPCDKDLVPYAERSMRDFMVLNPEPLADHPNLYRVMFDCYGLPPSMAANQWGWGDGTGRAIEAWLGVRQMTGDREFGLKIEQGQRDLMSWLLTADAGLAHVPEFSHPDKGTYYYHMWDQGRVLRALVRSWLAADHPAEKQSLAAKIDKMTESLDGLTTKGTDPQWGPTAQFAPGLGALNNGQPADVNGWCAMSAGQIIEPLAMYWPACKNSSVKAFTDALCNGVLAAGETSSGALPVKAAFRFGPDGSFTGHFHNKASITLGVARQGAALIRHGDRDRGLRLLRWAKNVYDWTLSPTNVNQGSTWGWFPENLGDGTQARTIMEVCCTADMIELATVLADAAGLDPTLAEWDGLWDHAERYTFNTIIPSQFVVTPAYADLVAKLKGDLKKADRLVGAWAGYHPPNDLVTMERDDGKLEMWMGCCCSYSGVRALNACWERVFSDDGENLIVRLPIARQSPTAAQTVVEGPDNVRQVVQLKEGRHVRVRLPDWTTADKVVASGRDGAKLTFTVEGRYLDFGKLEHGSAVTITYPLETRVTQERVGGDGNHTDFTPADSKPTYTARWRGNRVVSMEPAGRVLPIFPDR